jgi:tape measure domain-containing protein
MARVARLGIVIESSGARRGAQETNSALGSIDQTAQRTVKSLQQAAAALGVAFGIRALQQALDQYTLLDARLRQVTGSGANFARVQQQLFTIAQSSRSSYAATIDLYTKLARSSDQLGLSQGQLVSVTESVSAAVRLSNATTGAAEAGLVQLGQAFASGTLRGDELRSIMEQLPAVAKAIADGLGVPIGKLREMGEAGELSGRRVALALESQREKLALLAGEIPTTIGQALQQLNNAFGLVVAGSTEAKSATAGIAGVIGEAARFMVEYGDAVKAVALGLGVSGLAVAIGAATAGFTGIAPVATAAWVAITGPIGLALAGVTAITAGIYLLIKAFKEQKSESEQAAEKLAAVKKAAEDVYAEAKKVAGVSWAPPEMLKQIENLGGALRAAQRGGKQAGDAFQMAAEQFKDSGEKTRTFARALEDGDPKAKTLLATATALTSMQGQLAAATATGSKAQRDQSREVRTLDSLAREYEASLAMLNVELGASADAEREAARVRASEGATTVRQSIAARARELQQLNEQIDALLTSTGAYERVVQAQKEAAAAQEAVTQATAAGAPVDAVQLAALAAQAVELEKRKKLLKDLLGVEGKPLALPSAAGAAKETQSFADSMRDLLGVVQLVSQAFGGMGRSIAEAATGAQSIASGLSRGSNIKNSAGKAVSFSGALSGEAGASGVVAALGSAGAVVAGVVQVANALDVFGTRARERARELARLASEFNASLESFALTDRTALQSAQRQNLDNAAKLAQQAVAASGGSFSGTFKSSDDISALIAQLTAASGQSRLLAAALDPMIARLKEVEKETRNNERILAERNAAALRALDEDLTVRRLVAAGATEAADAERLRLTQLREIASVSKEFGEDSPYLVSLREVQKAEREAAETARALAAAERAIAQARQRDAFVGDVRARQQVLNGDERGALITRGTIQNASALADAEELVKAGTITREMFADLARVLGGELAQSIAAFDFAVAQAKQNLKDDLAVRELVATGRTKEADQLRREIAWRKELEGVTDVGLIVQLKYVQWLEQEAIIKAEAAEAARVIAQANADIDRQMIDALRTLNPAKAAELEAARLAAERAKQLADATDAGVQARLKELFTLQDQAKAMEAAAAAAEKAIAAERALADARAALDVRALVATGDTTGAEALRIRQANERELVGVTDESLRAQILYVQGLEAEARARATALAAAEAQAAQNADIDRRMIDVLRALDPLKAAELESKRQEIDRADELARAVDAATQGRLRELFAMQDAAAAQAKLTAELERQIDAAQRLANFTSSVEVDYLRATGRTFEADRRTLTEDRDRRLREAKEVGAAQSVVDMINATFDAKITNLIATTAGAATIGSNNTASNVMPPGTSLAPTLRENPMTTLGGDSTTFRGGASITETSAMRLIDYAASQLAVQRRILAVIEQRATDASTDLLPSLARAVDRSIGQASARQQRLVFGSIT